MIHDQSKNYYEIYQAESHMHCNPSGILRASLDALRREINGLGRYVLPKASVTKVALLAPGSTTMLTDAANLNRPEGGSDDDVITTFILSDFDSHLRECIT